MRNIALALAAVLACGTPPAPDTTRPPVASPEPAFTLVESFPIETSLDHPDIPEAHQVWRDMIDGATDRLDIAEFYASNQDDSRLEPIVQAIERAARRGVTVRFLADAGFLDTYPETLERLDRSERIEVRHYVGRDMAGGIHHAKYFVVDGVDAFLGSQNFDWRSLTHIQELGVRVRDPGTVRALADVFATDWTLSQGGDRGFRVVPPIGGYRSRAGARAVFSPRGWLPDETMWDLPQLVQMIDGARRTVRVQLLSYRANVPELDRALRDAAARGVRVQLIVSDWTKRPSQVDDVKALARVPGIDVAFMVIPPWSGGFVPYARVVHAKYLVVDREHLWVGTSNWERSYFEDSRNVGVILDDRDLAAAVDDFFVANRTGPYIEPVDPDVSYEPPRLE